MALTEADLVRLVRIELEEQPWQDYLTTAFNTGDVTMAVADPAKWAQGDIAEIDDGLGEMVLVKADGVAATPVSVRRAYNGTVAQDHATNTPVVKGRRWSYQQIASAIGKEVPRMWPHAWLEGGPTAVSPLSGVRWYALPGSAMDLIDVVQLRAGASLDYVRYGDGKGPPVVFEQRHPSFSLTVPAIGFPQGFATTLSPVKVSWRRKVLVAADVEDGLMAEVVVSGVCSRLMAAEETERTGEQTNIGNDAGPGTRLSDASWFEKLRDQKLFELNLQMLRDRPPMGLWRG